ncbi:Maf family protein [Thermodesulfobacteriota bacterium]
MTFKVISDEFPLVLASASPRRKMLLNQVGLPFRVFPTDIEENNIDGEPPEIACALAEKKAFSADLISPGSWVLGADTMVVMGEVILGKPRDNEDALYMLELLSGREHDVITGYCLLDPSGHVACKEHVATKVKVKELSSEERIEYIATKEPFGKAGSYAIQGIGSFMVESITGSYSNVVGLPICRLIKALRSAGAIKGFPLL